MKARSPSEQIAAAESFLASSSDGDPNHEALRAHARATLRRLKPSGWHVRVTLPNHRTAPNQTISCHHFAARSEAERYVEKVERDPRSFAAVMERCDGCTTYAKVTSEVRS